LSGDINSGTAFAFLTRQAVSTGTNSNWFSIIRWVLTTNYNQNWLLIISYMLNYLLGYSVRRRYLMQMKFNFNFFNQFNGTWYSKRIIYFHRLV
jgi:hypothetical protein